MKINLNFTKRKLIIAALLSVTTLAYCAPYDYWGLRKIDFELTGQALDFDTKAPLEGVYVLAVYEKVDLGFAASARFCIKTKGMMTGKDGKFHFPVEKLDGYSPHKLAAIKPDYAYHSFAEIPTEIWHKQNKASYENHHVYLKKQDPAKPDLNYGYDRCERPESKQAAEANIQFLQLQKTEGIRLASHFDWFKQWITSTDNLISYLQSR